MNRTLTGILNFHGWFHPWLLITLGEKFNIFPEVQKIFKALNGQSVTFKQGIESFAFMRDETSDFILEFSEGIDSTTAFLKRKDGNGGSNLGAYLPDALQWINGRTVTFSSTESTFEVVADPNEKVFTLPFTLNNSCLIPKGKEKEICKLGTDEGCLFCSLNGDQEWYCEKGNSSIALVLLNKLGDGASSSRIGNCLIKGREDDKERGRKEFQKMLGEEVIITEPINGRSKGAKARIYNGYTYGCMGNNEIPLVFEGETSFEGTDRNHFEYATEYASKRN